MCGCVGVGVGVFGIFHSLEQIAHVLVFANLQQFVMESQNVRKMLENVFFLK